MTDTNTAQLVVDLKATDDAVRAQGWVAPGLGVPGAPLGLLGSTLNPLTGLATAGLSWFMPFVSFLGEGLTQLQGGNAASVTSGSQDFGGAGQDIAGVAEDYRASATAQTSNWSGAAASDYRDTAQWNADGIAGFGQASTTVGNAIIGAGQVVAQAIAEITELIAEAVAQIVPIMTQAVARAGETFGQSVVEAIPPCVGIAVEYALRIAAKLAALVASGDNLLKLVQGAMAVTDLIETAMSSISQQSIRPDAQAGSSTSADQRQTGVPMSTPAVGNPGSTGASTPTTSTGGLGGTPYPTDDVSSPSRPAAPLAAATQSSGAVVPVVPSVPSVPEAPTGGVPTSAALSGGVTAGAVGPAPGARVGTGRGADTARQEGQQPARVSSTGGSTPGGVPLGPMGSRPAGDADKEHQRKYRVVEEHEEAFVVAPQVITSERPPR
jgi:hypothetical protein